MVCIVLNARSYAHTSSVCMVYTVKPVLGNHCRKNQPVFIVLNLCIPNITHLIHVIRLMPSAYSGGSSDLSELGSLHASLYMLHMKACTSWLYYMYENNYSDICLNSWWHNHVISQLTSPSSPISFRTQPIDKQLCNKHWV